MNIVKNKLLIFILIPITLFVGSMIYVFLYFYSLQKETCKRSIEYSLVIAINLEKVKLQTPLDNSWKELNSNEQRHFLEYLSENRNQYTECIEDGYLVEGKDSNGTKLSFFGRKENLNTIEITLAR